MCGISGVYLTKDKSVDEGILDSFNQQLHHRGPDACGKFIHKNIALAHTRLKILDLSDLANQPFVSSDKKFALVFNGEIYNYQDLRSDLIKQGHIFKTTGDTEVLFYGLIHYGKNFIEKLNGIFSFAFLDMTSPSSKLLLARDRFGVKPLFITFKDGQLAFSSTLSPLMKLPWIKKEIDPQSLFYYLKFGHVPCTQSILKDIDQVAPGSYLFFDGTSYQEEKYFNLFAPPRIDCSLNEPEALKELEQIFIDSVKRQSVSDVPVGIFLSGGIDSSLLTAIYSQHVNKNVCTFSIGYKEKEFDETTYAKTVADIFKTNHYEILVSPQDIFREILEIPKYFDQPFSDPTMLPTLLLCQHAKKQVTVALSGDGGDELFFGYTYQQMMFYLRHLDKIPSQLRSMVLNFLKWIIQHYPGEIPLTFQQISKFCDILSFKNRAEFLMYFIGTIGPLPMDHLKKLTKTVPKDHTQLFNQIITQTKNAPFLQIEKVFQSTFLPETVLQKTDRASMAFGLEARVPFLDNDLYNFSSKLPPSLKYQKGVKKYLLRKFACKHFPQSIFDRKKQGFSIPMREWIRGDLKYLLDDYLSETRLKNDPHINSKEVGRLTMEHFNKKANHNHLLWSLVVYQLWKEYYNIN